MGAQVATYPLTLPPDHLGPSDPRLLTPLAGHLDIPNIGGIPMNPIVFSANAELASSTMMYSLICTQPTISTSIRYDES